jgi:hypothetical protein
MPSEMFDSHQWLLLYCTLTIILILLGYDLACQMCIQTSNFHKKSELGDYCDSNVRSVGPVGPLPGWEEAITLIISGKVVLEPPLTVAGVLSKSPPHWTERAVHRLSVLRCNVDLLKWRAMRSANAWASIIGRDGRAHPNTRKDPLCRNNPPRINLTPQFSGCISFIPRV